MSDITSENPPGAVGQHATRPTRIPLRGYGQIASRIVSRVIAANLMLLAAGVAFFGLLAVFPTISAFVAIAGLVIDPTDLTDTIEPILATLPPSAADIIHGQFTDLILTDNDSLGFALILSLALALFSASRGTVNLISGLNISYDEVEARGFFMVQGTALLLTFGGVVALVAIFAVVAALPFWAASVSTVEQGALVILAQAARWPILLLMAIFGFSLLYRYGPSRRPANWRWLTPGAGIAVAMWILATYGFSFYVQNFSSYGETFGAIAGVIVLMLWLWISAFTILLGALLDAEIEAQTSADTTIGPPKPMGERGAVKADTCDAAVE